MGEDFQLIEIIFLAAIAVFVVLRLRQILGRKTGNERRRDPFAAREQLTTPAAKDKAAEGARAPADSTTPADDKRARIGTIAPEGSALNQALTEIQLADRQFDVDRFLGGARSAYQLILNAFAKGDKEALKPLLADDVYEHFSADIDAREGRGETMQFEVVSIKDAQISGATLENRQAEITVTFETEITKAITDKDGELVSGDPSTVVNVIDIWSFTRDVKSKAPDWILTATDTAE